MISNPYPFAEELITDSQGHIVKVILEWNEYKRLLEAVEEEGLYRAMMEVKDEIPLRMDKALFELEKE